MDDLSLNCGGEGVVEDLLDAGWLVASQVQTLAGCYSGRQVGRGRHLA